MSKQNFYDVFAAVEAALRQTIEAGQACAEMRSDKFPFLASLSGVANLALALKPSPVDPAWQQLHDWQTKTAKDERRAVRVLYLDYEALRRGCVALLAQEVSQ